jgi:hypothetical protein
MQKILSFLVLKRVNSADDSSFNQPLISNSISTAVCSWVSAHANPSLYLEILLQFKGSLPILIERWTFVLNSSPFNQDTAGVSIRLFEKAVMQLATIIPRIANSDISFSLSQTPTKNWLKPSSDIKKFPLKLSANNFSINLTAEVLNEFPVNEIKNQETGGLMRFLSTDVFEYNEKNSDIEYSQSSDEPIVCLNKLNLSKCKSYDCANLANKICSHEHEFMGFTPLSHTICTENCSFESFSDSSNDTETLFVESGDDREMSVDAAISKYKRSCEKMSKVRLFEEAEEVDLEKLQYSLQKIRNTLDLL